MSCRNRRLNEGAAITSGKSTRVTSSNGHRSPSVGRRRNIQEPDSQAVSSSSAAAKPSCRDAVAILRALRVYSHPRGLQWLGFRLSIVATLGAPSAAPSGLRERRAARTACEAANRPRPGVLVHGRPSIYPLQSNLVSSAQVSASEPRSPPSRDLFRFVRPPLPA